VDEITRNITMPNNDIDDNKCIEIPDAFQNKDRRDPKTYRAKNQDSVDENKQLYMLLNSIVFQVCDAFSWNAFT
jgi:hypothetical protein